ncbi:MAG: alanyl-tRNA synthetase [Rickettsiales bacterium]|jgi:alanyl-tRNA synthetase
MDSSYKVIADHLRSSSFIIADGVMPSNEGRGYVLRRIMRRAMRHIHKLGAKDPVMHKLVPSLIKEMGEAFPELIRAESAIIDTLKTEEERFRKTLGGGMKILSEEITKIDSKVNKFSGEIAFKLYDTYGFPLDLTEDILREKNIEVDVVGFNLEMEKQKKRSSENWTGSGEVEDSNIYFELKRKLPKTEFLGYKSTKSSAKILTILQNGQEIPEAKKDDKNIEIILDQTPFYATSGGQKGDDGNLILKSESQENELINYFALENVIDIFEAKKAAGDLFIHHVSEIRGNFKVGDEVIALVNNRSRQFREQNHSATHLLHFVLKQVLGSHISQKGSSVDDCAFTFDFNHNKALTSQEVDQIEDLVNFLIRQNSPIVTEILPIDEAREKGAMALFGEKYDDVVRVLQMGKSIELCGGTHAKSTGNIGIFKIISEKGIAAGIRRIEAKTGFFALEYSRLQERKLQSLIESLKVKQQFEEVKMPTNEFHNAKKGFDDLCFFRDEDAQNEVVGASEISSMSNVVEKIYQLGESKVSEIKILQKEIDKLKKEKLASSSNITTQKIGEINFIHHFFEGANAKEVRDLASETKNKKEYQENSIILFFGSENEKISAVLAISYNLTSQFHAGKIIPQIAMKIGGKGGGGKPDLAMCGGSNKDGIAGATKLITCQIEKAL